MTGQEVTGELIEIKSDIRGIKEDIGDIKVDLAAHMARSKASEDRIELMEDFAKSAMDNQQKNFELMLKSNKDHQSAMNRQLKIALGVFAALAALVSALAAFK